MAGKMNHTKKTEQLPDVSSKYYVDVFIKQHFRVKIFYHYHFQVVSKILLKILVNDL